TLPAGSQRQFDTPVSVAQIAENIAPGLPKAPLAGKVDGNLVDTSHLSAAAAEHAEVAGTDEHGHTQIRRFCAQLLAQAIKALFPSAQVTIGPVIEDGFYYDFAFERPFTPEDLEKIEAKMEELARADIPVARELMDRDDAVPFFKNMGQDYKAEIIASIPAN